MGKRLAGFKCEKIVLSLSLSAVAGAWAADAGLARIVSIAAEKRRVD
jgi:hypothetical protein